jgi:hypothetical protein
VIVTLRIRQYVYFAVDSSAVPAAEMTTAIGLTPDKIMVRGSRRNTNPPVPRSHSWQVICDAPGWRVDEQLEQLIHRLRPYQHAIRALCDDLRTRESDSRAGASLQIVRYLDDRDGEADGEQHRLLGWHLDTEVLQFAIDVGAAIDADEYGQALPWSWLPELIDSMKFTAHRLRRRWRQRR